MNSVNKTTIYDVAKAAGTSPRSVTRAFQKNSPVSESTRKRILDIALKMGYKPNKAAARIRSQEIKIGVAVKSTIDVFYDELIDGCRTSGEKLTDYKAQIYIKTCSDSDEMTEAIKDLIDLGINGLILCDNTLSSDVKEYLNDKHLPVMTMIMRPMGINPITHITVNTELKGRMAGEMLSLLCPNGRVSVFTGDLRYEHHKSIFKGFLNEIEKHDLTLVQQFDTMDIPGIAADAALDLVNNRDICDCIFFASANSETAIEVFINNDYHPVIIGSDVFPKMSEYIKGGTVAATIYQNPHSQGEIAVRNMYDYLTEHTVFKKYTYITPQICLSSNLSEYEFNK